MNPNELHADACRYRNIVRAMTDARAALNDLADEYEAQAGKAPAGAGCDVEKSTAF
jgi:hypothetical protein